MLGGHLVAGGRVFKRLEGIQLLVLETIGVSRVVGSKSVVVVQTPRRVGGFATGRVLVLVVVQIRTRVAPASHRVEASGMRQTPSRLDSAGVDWRVMRMGMSVGARLVVVVEEVVVVVVVKV